MGYPTNNTRVILIANRTGMDMIIEGQCSNCGGVRVRNVQVCSNASLSGLIFECLL
jgi:hypothetical protein